MKRRNIFVIGIVFVLIIAVFGLKNFTTQGDGKVQKNSEVKRTLKEEYEVLRKGSKPSIIIFSYDADCCENTKKFFNEYNNKVKQLTKDYDKKFNVMFINTGILKEDDKDMLMKIAKENGTSQLPAISIRDSKGTVIKIIEGVFDAKEVRKILDEVKS